MALPPPSATGNRPHRLAVVGIDGAGKSTVIGRVLELAPAGRDRTAILRCPAYHETPDAPLGSLSRALDAFGRAADLLGSYELKAAALYLQMTLYGPIERSLTEIFRPLRILSERHALVDSLAYGPFYSQMVRETLDPDLVEEPLRRRMEDLVPGSYPTVRRWHEIEVERLDLDVSFWNLAADVSAIFALPFPERLAELSRRYRCELPDVVLILDPGAAEAEERISARDGSVAELHEERTILEALRQSYLGLAEELPRRLPSMTIDIVRTGDGTSIDETLRAVLDRTDSSGG